MDIYCIDSLSAFNSNTAHQLQITKKKKKQQQQQKVTYVMKF